jgi:hypothetical protein
MIVMVIKHQKQYKKCFKVISLSIESILRPTMLPVQMIIVKPSEPTGNMHQLFILRLYTCSSVMVNKEDRGNIVGEGLEEEPPLETRVMVGVSGF